MDKDTKAVYAELRRVAKSAETTHYFDIATLAGLDMDSQTDRNRIGEILDSISRAEHAAGRPLLSAVVVQKGEEIPSRGFFNLASRLGLRDASTDVHYWRRELQRVWDHWSKTASCQR